MFYNIGPRWGILKPAPHLLVKKHLTERHFFEFYSSLMNENGGVNIFKVITDIPNS
jgi:hypothetical protein